MPPMKIDPPRTPIAHPDRLLACEEALSEPFYAIVEREPSHPWVGDESALWPLRRSAVAAGWQIGEVEQAIERLIETLPAAIKTGI